MVPWGFSLYPERWEGDTSIRLEARVPHSPSSRGTPGFEPGLGVFFSYHQGIGNMPIGPWQVGTGEIICDESLHGLLKSFRRAA